MVTAPTLRSLTPPGFFNFSSEQTEMTGKLAAWVDAIFALRTEQVNLYDDIFRLWASRDYSEATMPRTPYLAYLANQHGLGWFLGSNTQMAALLYIARRGWAFNDTENMLYLLSAFSAAPFLWIDSIYSPQVTFGTQQPAIFAENFIAYSSSVSEPPKPDNQPYIERAWEPSIGWAKQPSSATFYSRGYLQAGQIIWTDPFPTSLIYTSVQIANLAALPPAPTPGDIAFVKDDGSGDRNAVYFADVDSTWFKNTSPNANQGITANVPPVPAPRAVYSPDPVTSPFPITSERPPPADGPSQGYGMYAGYSQQVLSSSQIEIALVLTPAGRQNLNVIVYFFRRIKPAKNSLSLFYSTLDDPTPPTRIFIKDTGDI